MRLLTKGKVLVGLAALCVCKGVYGQTQGKMEILPAKEGWFLGVGAGVQVYAGEGDGAARLGDRISPAGELNVGKWITPTVGVRMQMEGAHMVGAEKGMSEGWNYVHIHIDGMADLAALLRGVDAERKHTVLGMMGVGVATPAHKVHNRTTPSFTMGMAYRFRASEHIDLIVEGKGYLVGDKLNGVDGGRKGEGALALTAGFTYNF